VLRRPLQGLGARLAVIAAVLAPTLLLWDFEQDLTRKAQEPLLAQSRQALLMMAAADLVEPMWTIDERAIAAAAQRAFEGSSVLRLRARESRPGATPLDLVKPDVASDGIRLATTISREGVAVGEVEIWFDDRQIDRLLAERRQATLQLAGLQVLLGVGVLMSVLYRRLIVPIGLLKRQASEIASRVDVAPVDWSRRDEIGQLGQHLNEVHGQIDQLFDQLEVQKAELEKIALHDPLTGLPNRALFRELTQSSVASARREGGRLALLFIDLDRFKAINDSLGHAAGDAVLVTLAARLRAAVRASDVVCRHSGDEFTVLLRNPHPWEDVAATADRLLQQMEIPVDVNGREATVSASIGIALYPDDASDHEELVRHADTAMYAAKKLGRARCSFYRSEFNEQLQANLKLEQEIAQALKNDEFVLHFQPQVAAGTGALVGCEALIRWRHPERGLVAPAEFIGVAEQCGLIGEVGAWVVRAACAQIRAWKHAGVVFGHVAVNISALEFSDHRLVDRLTQAMAEFDVRPDELEIEITESVLMTDAQTAQHVVERLRGLGLRLAVDDFGTGYSSLAYLKHLRPSKVKIDRSFVRDLSDDEDDRVVVHAIVQLAHMLGSDVVAEGVETVAQRDFLCRIGCDVLQGYLISRPQAASAFARMAGGLQPEVIDEELVSWVA